MDRRGDVRRGAQNSRLSTVQALVIALALGACGPTLQAPPEPVSVPQAAQPKAVEEPAAVAPPPQAVTSPTEAPAPPAPIPAEAEAEAEALAADSADPQMAREATKEDGRQEVARAPARKPPARPAQGPGRGRSMDDLLDNALSGKSKRRAAAPRIAHGTVGGGGQGSGYGRGAGGIGKRPRRLAIAGPHGPMRFQEVLPEHNTEDYAHVRDNPFRTVADKPLSTFSIDVDTASYSNVRRMLNQQTRPPADAVRIEELVNYFRYDYPEPRGATPFSVYTEVASAPWSPRHRLVHIGLKGRSIEAADVPARNLVFLLDVSGSMRAPDKLPLLKRGMALLARQLREQDRLTIVAYAGASGLVLPPTSGAHQGEILAALDRLQSGGSTNGGAGIQLAYGMAQQEFIRGGINRVILATDGDFNVGVTGNGELTRLIEERRKSGVFLTVLGFGRGNLKDSTMETLADKGNGNYAYIDSIQEARKVLVREAGSTLVTIAKDVKLQIEWNPKLVASYRLIGYENRMLAARDFNDDKKDAGEIGAGHTVTALYEVVLRGADNGRPEVDPLKYQADRALTGAAESGEMMTVKIRYKQPDGKTSKLLSKPVVDAGQGLDRSSRDFRFSAAVAGFGMLLRGSEHGGDASIELVRDLARDAIGRDEHGDRRELLQLMDAAARMGVGPTSG